MTQTRENIKKLNKLLNINTVLEELYSKASIITESENLKTVFSDFANQRKSFVKELEIEISRYGQKPSKILNDKDKPIANWEDFKALILTSKDRLVFDEIIRIEKLSIKNYHNAVKGFDFPIGVHSILLKHIKKIQVGLSQLNL